MPSRVQTKAHANSLPTHTQVIGAIREAAQTRHCVSLTIDRGGDRLVVVVTMPHTRPGVLVRVKGVGFSVELFFPLGSQSLKSTGGARVLRFAFFFFWRWRLSE